MSETLQLLSIIYNVFATQYTKAKRSPDQKVAIAFLLSAMELASAPRMISSGCANELLAVTHDNLARIYVRNGCYGEALQHALKALTDYLPDRTRTLALALNRTLALTLTLTLTLTLALTLTLVVWISTLECPQGTRVSDNLTYLLNNCGIPVT